MLQSAQEIWYNTACFVNGCGDSPSDEAIDFPRGEGEATLAKTAFGTRRVKASET